MYRASTTYLRASDKLSIDDLLHLAPHPVRQRRRARAARVSPYGSEGFVRRMNEKAAELDRMSTQYADPSGLLSDNVSSAYDSGARSSRSRRSDERISKTMRMSEYTVHAARRDIAIRSTNHLLGRDDIDVMGAKTGFISKSGYRLATLLRGCPTAVSRSRSSSSVRVRTPAASWRRRTWITWLASKASTIFATKTPAPTSDA